MRKGRSQRKARASLPPHTARTKPSRAELGTSDPAPRVGVATHTRSEQAQAGQGISTGGPRKPTLEMLTEPMLELVREAELLELAEAEVEPAKTELPSVEAVKPMSSELVTVERASSDESPVRRAVLPTPDEMSIPPMGDLSVEPVADRFFSEGEFVAARASAHEHEHEWAEVVARESRKSLPEVVERRARLSKYVRWAVGGAAVLCLAALGRTLVAPSTPASGPAASAVNELRPVAAAARVEAPEAKAAAPAVAKAEPAAVAPAAAAPAAPAAEPAKTAELAAAPAAPAASVEAPKVDIPKAEAPAAAPAGDKTALDEKNESRRALERGKPADAIAAGERSVALDPTDGEAWLLLGASYQDKGNMAEARRAYLACTKEGKRGPIGECRAMLR